MNQLTVRCPGCGKEHTFVEKMSHPTDGSPSLPYWLPQNGEELINLWGELHDHSDHTDNMANTDAWDCRACDHTVVVVITPPDEGEQLFVPYTPPKGSTFS